jgi:hypothetical protein
MFTNGLLKPAEDTMELFKCEQVKGKYLELPYSCVLTNPELRYKKRAYKTAEKSAQKEVFKMY